MKPAIIIATLVASAFAAGVSPAAAYDYPYCLQGRQFGYPGNCQFQTYQQCMVTASGTDSACGINPMAAYARQGRNTFRYLAR